MATLPSLKIKSAELGAEQHFPLKTDGITDRQISLMVKSDIHIAEGGAQNITSLDPSGSREPLITVNTSNSPARLAFLRAIEASKEIVDVTATSPHWDRDLIRKCQLKEMPEVKAPNPDLTFELVIVQQ